MKNDVEGLCHSGCAGFRILYSSQDVYPLPLPPIKKTQFCDFSRFVYLSFLSWYVPLMQARSTQCLANEEPHYI